RGSPTQRWSLTHGGIPGELQPGLTGFQSHKRLVKMNRDVIRQIVNVIIVIATLAVNSLSQVLPFNGQTSAEIANRYADRTFFLPANYVFSVWGVIYIGMIAFAIFQALPSQRENPRLR